MTARAVVFALVVTASACGRIGFDALGAGSGAADGAADGVAVDRDGPASCAVPLCPDRSASVDSTSQVGTGAEVAADRGLVGSCGGAGGGEATFRVTPVGAGTYRFVVRGGDPLVAYLRDGCCGGPELACTTRPATTPIIHALQAQQVVFLIVDDAQLGTNVSLEVGGI